MRYETIRDETLAGCMMKIRSRFGSEVSIISRRQVREPGMFNLPFTGKKLYEVEIMIPEKDDPYKKRNRFSHGNERRKKEEEKDAYRPTVRATEADFFSYASRFVDKPAGRARPATDLSDSQKSILSSSAQPARQSFSSTLSADSETESSTGISNTKEEKFPEMDSLMEFLKDLEKKARQDNSATTEEKKDSVRQESSLRHEQTEPKEYQDRQNYPPQDASKSWPESKHETESQTRAASGPPKYKILQPSSEEIAALWSESEPNPAFYSGESSTNTGKVDPQSDPGVQNLLKIRKRLLGSYLSEGFTEGFMGSLEKTLSRNDVLDYQVVEQKTLEALADKIRSVPSVVPPGKTRALMFVGPGGGGKTLSVIRLASHYWFVQQRDVSIYSLDQSRVAATQSLRLFAESLDIPFFTPFGPDEFREMLDRDGAEVILIDTAGIGYQDYDRMIHLNAFIKASNIDIEKHLVLPASMGRRALERILETFDREGFDRILLTKLDEVDFLGTFIEHADKFNRPFSFFMQGQDQFEEIKNPEPMELARLVLEEKP